MPKLFKPGQKIKRSGQYEKIGPRGGKTKKEITGVKGKVFPPSVRAGMNPPAASRSLIPLRSISAGYLGASLWNLGKPTVSQTLP